MTESAQSSELRDQLAIERTRLANERTLLAYVRTALGLLGAGAVVLQLLPGTMATGVGATLMLAGVGLLVVGGVRFQQVRRSLPAQQRTRSPAS